MGKKKKDVPRGKHAANVQDSLPVEEASATQGAEESVQVDAESPESPLTPDEKGPREAPLADAPAPDEDGQEGEEAPEADEPSYGAYESSYETLIQKKRKTKRNLKATGILCGSVVGLALIAYLAGCVYFMGHFYPNTTLGDVDISLKAPAEVEPMIEKGISAYHLSVEGEGITFDYSAQDLGLSWDEQAIVANAFADVKPWQWPFEAAKTHDEGDKLRATYAKSDIAAQIQAQVAAFDETATQPTNATIAYDSTQKEFEIVPEEFGTALDANSVARVIDAAVVTLRPTAEITKDELVFPLVGAESDILRKACTSANFMLKSDLTLMLGDFKVTELSPDDIAPWIRLDEGMQVVFDDASLDAWIESIIAGCDTIGSERTYTRPDGKEITVEGGTYGWEIDGDALRGLVKDNIGGGKPATLDIPVIQAGTGFTGIGGRDWGNRYCDVDLSEQHARYYDDDGNCIWESDIISGRPTAATSTPTGVWMINTKASPSILIGEPLPGKTDPEYRTTVTYWMPFVGNAVGLHDATWQPSFGGSMYANGYGSHGCVNLPYSAAEDLYALIQVGDPVVAHW